MPDFFALLLATSISLLLSTATVFAIQAPLRALLAAICPLGFTAEFWTRAAITLLYLMPLWVVLVFGMPNLDSDHWITASEIARRALASSSFALFAIVIATGLRLAAIRPAGDFGPVR
jgi:hypothetical protein